MIYRRGSLIQHSALAGIIDNFKPDIMVWCTSCRDITFKGKVVEVDKKINKVWVMWPGGKVNQHDPDELSPCNEKDWKNDDEKDTSTLKIATISEYAGNKYYAEYRNRRMSNCNGLEKTGEDSEYSPSIPLK